MNDEDIAKLTAKITKNLATKDDLKNFATKDDLKTLATKDDLKNFATKDDFSNLKKSIDKRFGELNEKVDQILDYADVIEETVDNHDKRLKKLESMTSIKH